LPPPSVYGITLCKFRPILSHKNDDKQKTFSKMGERLLFFIVTALPQRKVWKMKSKI
jgi:hypothetical protein